MQDLVPTYVGTRNIDNRAAEIIVTSHIINNLSKIRNYIDMHLLGNATIVAYLN